MKKSSDFHFIVSFIAGQKQDYNMFLQICCCMRSMQWDERWISAARLRMQTGSKSVENCGCSWACRAAEEPERNLIWANTERHESRTANQTASGWSRGAEVVEQQMEAKLQTEVEHCGCFFSWCCFSRKLQWFSFSLAAVSFVATFVY